MLAPRRAQNETIQSWMVVQRLASLGEEIEVLVSRAVGRAPMLTQGEFEVLESNSSCALVRADYEELGSRTVEQKGKM